MTKKIIILMVAVLFGFIAINGCGETVKEVSGGTGNVEGTVYSADGTTPISGASVVSGTYNTTTNDTGFFRIELPSGTRDILISKGVFSTTLSGVDVVADSTITVGGSTGVLLVATEKIAVVTGAY
jgi:hypothetical protein